MQEAWLQMIIYLQSLLTYKIRHIRCVIVTVVIRKCGRNGLNISNNILVFRILLSGFKLKIDVTQVSQVYNFSLLSIPLDGIYVGFSGFAHFLTFQNSALKNDHFLLPRLL